jgi:glycine oxidase
MAHSKHTDLLVVGGGVIGMAIAWRAAPGGVAVGLLERGRLGDGASRVAAGMLAPVAEAEFGTAGRGLLELGLSSLRAWPRFAAELEAAGGTPVGFREEGTLLVARDADDARELERQLEFRGSLGLEVRRLRASQARALEPALAPTLRLALEAPGDRSVDPRRVLVALERACRESGVEIHERAPVAELLLEADASSEHGRRMTGVQLDGGERVQAADVVLAAGAWSERLGGLPAGAYLPVRPVKGQTLRLRDPAGPGLVGRVLRFRGGYLVPREDGRYVLGATVEERGFELSATAGGVYELLRDAHELVPGISELEIEELSVGLRPGTPDNAPAIGDSGVAGLLWATGHYRNGILLAPLTADLVLGMLSGADGDEELRRLCSPRRFAAGDGRVGGVERARGAGGAGGAAGSVPAGVLA